jgi:hypothetical protein
MVAMFLKFTCLHAETCSLGVAIPAAGKLQNIETSYIKKCPSRIT